MSSSSFLKSETKDYCFCPNCKKLVKIEYAVIGGEVFLRCSECGCIFLNYSKEGGKQ